MLQKTCSIALVLCLFFTFSSGQDNAGIFDNKRKEVDISNYYITLNLQDALNGITAAVEWKVDSLIKTETNPAIQNNLILLKYNLITVLSRTAFHSDPLIGALDTWALGYQLTDYFSGSRCDSLYGRHCVVLKDMLTRYTAGYERTLSKYVSEKNRQDLKSFATNHPITNDNLSRKTVVTYVSAWVSEDELRLKSGLLTMTDLLRDMSFRLQYYSELLPKQTKWQMENSWRTYMGTDSLTTLISTLQQVLDVSARTLEKSETIINFNRDTVLANINHQRILSFQAIRNERIAVLDAVANERAILLETLQAERKAMQEYMSQERSAAMTDMKGISHDMLDQTVPVGKELIDYIFWKVLIIVAVLGIFFMGGLFLHKRRATS